MDEIIREYPKIMSFKTTSVNCHRRNRLTGLKIQ